MDKKTNNFDKLISIEIKIKRVATSYKLSSCNYEKSWNFLCFVFELIISNTYNKIRKLEVWYTFNYFY